LQRICDKWLSLPDHIRTAIMALVEYHQRGRYETP
jgi:hypothetical protein